MRALWPESRLPIILLSANTEEQSVSTGLKLGCNDYVRWVLFLPCSLQASRPWLGARLWRVLLAA